MLHSGSRPCGYPYRGYIGNGGGGFAGGLTGGLAGGYRQNQFNMNNFRRRKLFHHEIDMDKQNGVAMNKFGAGGFGGVGAGSVGGVLGGYDVETMAGHDYGDYYD